MNQTGFIYLFTCQDLFSVIMSKHAQRTHWSKEKKTQTIQQT